MNYKGPKHSGRKAHGPTDEYQSVQQQARKAASPLAAALPGCVGILWRSMNSRDDEHFRYGLSGPPAQNQSLLLVQLLHVWSALSV